MAYSNLNSSSTNTASRKAHPELKGLQRSMNRTNELLMRPSSVLSNERKPLGARGPGSRVPMAGMATKTAHPPKTTYAKSQAPNSDTASFSSAQTPGVRDSKNK